MTRIGFGTDGWRGVIADGFTMENLGVMTQAVMTYLKRAGGPKSLYIGYDTRFMSAEAARRAASVAAGNGFRVVMSTDYVTTPMLSHAAGVNPSSGGLMVTASHNPYKYNGLKFKQSFGGSACREISAEIETLIGAEPVASLSWGEAKSRGLVAASDFFGPYSKSVYGALDLDTLRSGSVDAVFDCMHGTTGPYAETLWNGLGLELKTIRTSRDPYFGGSQPEPAASGLSALSSEVVEGGYQVGLAADGDGDRLGVVDSAGRFVDAHVILSLLVGHLARNRGMTGMVVKTVSTSTLVDRVAADMGLPVVETPVGFKNICELMLVNDVMIGGEENGGVGVKGFIPERDGMLAGLLVVEMLSAEGRGLAELVNRLDERYGRLYYKRNDLRLSRPFGPKEFGLFGEGLKGLFADFGVDSVSRVDGHKVFFRDGSWILFRLSGTEPLVRVYAETGDEARLVRLMQRAMEGLDA